MENPVRKKNQVQPQRHRPIRIIGGGGGDIGAVVAWGGGMAVAGLVAGFAIKRRFGRTKNPKEPAKKTMKEEVVKKTEIDSCDLVSAILGEKPKGAKDDGARENVHPENVPRVINYGIPAPLDIVDPYNTINPDIEEIIPFNKLKPEFIAGIVEECKSLAVDKVDPPVPLKEGKVPVERLILKPILSQVTLEAEPLLSPIKEVEEHDDDDDEYEDEDEQVEYAGEGDEDEASEETCAMFNDEAIWPAEILQELSRELKAMKIDLERPQELDMVARSSKTSKNEQEKVEAVPAAVAQTAKLSRSRARLWLSMLVMFLLVLLISRFDAMSCTSD